jgi:hypothetical protein
MDHLLSTYPTSLSAWKSTDTSRTIPSVENIPFLVLNPSHVNSTCHGSSPHDIKKTLDGAEWSLYEDTQATQGGKCTYNERSMKTVKLNWADQKMCIKGRNNILLRQNGQALKIAKGIRGPGQPSTTQTTPGTPNAGPGGASALTGSSLALHEPVGNAGFRPPRVRFDLAYATDLYTRFPSTAPLEEPTRRSEALIWEFVC